LIVLGWPDSVESLALLFARLPETSVALVYQHRPRRRWADLFADLAGILSYVQTAVAVHESDLALVAMANNVASGKNIAAVMKSYADSHPAVRLTSLF
jgi:hypothetical protein